MTKFKESSFLKPFGLYLHIPFCSQICHYCDFAKTARWSHEGAGAYINTLGEHLKEWLKHLQNPSFSSVFFGGGTPSLFSHEYNKLFETITPRLSKTPEITLEANPKDISIEKLMEWKKLGINRLSLGIQTFDETGLRFLTRDHTKKEALGALELASEHMANVSLDLIYGWPGQTRTMFDDDLRLVEPFFKKNLNHVSLYFLTYAPKTPIGRRHERGLIKEPEDVVLEEFYLHAQESLKNFGIEQYEVSNWAKPGFESKHNQLYWTMGHYLSVGQGACGFLESSRNTVGIRYCYPNRSLLKGTSFQDKASTQELLRNLGCEIDERNDESFILELLTCGLRTREGVSLEALDPWIKALPCPTPYIQSAIDQGLIAITPTHIKLHPKEWIRENTWAAIINAWFDAFQK